MQCFACHRPVTAGALIDDADGNRWHVTCYRDAIVRAGGDDPCPPCDDCGQLIWETEPTLLHEKFENGAWRPARWHPECAPKAATLGRLENDPPPPPQAVAVELERAAAPTTPASTEGNASQPGGRCPGCHKPAQRNRVHADDNTIWHQRCYDKAIRAAARADKRATAKPNRRGALHSGNKARQTCAKCDKKIRNAGIEPIECEKEGGGTDFFHKRCYRDAMMEGGQPDPFPPKHPIVAAAERAHKRRHAPDGNAASDAQDGASERRARTAPQAPREPKELTLHCSLCGQEVARSTFRDHVSAHEREPGGWEYQS